MSAELVQSVVEILDSAHQQRYQLSELLTSLAELKQQVRQSADVSRSKLKVHFDGLKCALNEAVDARLSALMGEINDIEENAMTPLGQCEEMIQQGIDNAANVMEEGSLILKSEPENNVQKIVKFKDNPHTKTLSSLPEIPCRSAVPDISVEVHGGPLREKICKLITREGKVSARAPVQITDIVERPGGLVVHWTEVDDDVEVNEFCLEISNSNVKINEDPNVIWHASYVGRDSSCIVKHLHINETYSFRVAGRVDSNSNWSSWSLPSSAITTIPHYQWSTENEAYSMSNEDRTATRVGGFLTSVLYSGAPSVPSGEQICFRVLDTGEKSFDDVMGLSWSQDDKETLIRPGAVCVGTNGKVHVDGQEMKTKLSPINRGCKVTFKTEPLSNGKVRVTVDSNDKEVAFDWKIDTSVGGVGFVSAPVMGFPLNRQFSAHQFYFAMKFTHEDWKIAVE